MPKFSEDFLIREAKRLFGVSSFRGLQLPVIQAVCELKSVLVIFPTGMGKSLTYQLPSQLLDGLTLVVTPLISLMQDQVDGLRRRGVFSADYLASSQTLEEQREIFSRLGSCTILYVSPERVQSEVFRNQLQKYANPVRLVVVDEAHCVSTWGLSFRPGYRKLSQVSVWFPRASLMALTATATAAIKRDIIRVLRLKKALIFEQPSVRRNISIQVEFLQDFKERLKALLKDRLPTVIYSRSRYVCEQLTHELRGSGFSARAYHAGMEATERERVQSLFVKNQINILVATTAFGMGVDKSDIRRVIHLQIPGELEEYTQEIGRAGRDGEDADAWFLIRPADFKEVIQQTLRSYPDWMDLKKGFEEPQSEWKETAEHFQDLFGAYGWKAFKRFYRDYLKLKSAKWRKLEQMLNFIGDSQCRSSYLSRYFGFETQPCGTCDLCVLDKRRLTLSKEAQKMERFLRATGSVSFSTLRNALQGRDSGFLLYPSFGKFCGVGTSELWKVLLVLLNHKRVRFLLKNQELFLKSL